MDFVIFILAMGALIFGADFIVNQSERLAIRFRISEFVIGATVIAIGTSLPEIAASVAASLDGKSEIAIANAVGSNIFNITLVLAIVFILTRHIHSDHDFFAKDAVWTLLPIILFLMMSLDGRISKLDGILLLIVMFSYMLFLLQDSKGFGMEVLHPITEKHFRWGRTLGLLLLGFIFVVGGAHFAIESASNIAQEFGVSEWAIGIIMISFGTSLPELVVSISATLKGKLDMAVGNIIGSNIANTTLVIGIAALVNSLPISLEKNAFDLATMSAATLMLVFITAHKLYARPAGISLAVLFVLFLNHTLHGMA